MAKYYFHARKGSSMELYEDGLDFPTLALAKADALVAAREMLVEKAINGDSPDDEVFEIVNEDGQIVTLVPFSPSRALK
ncbi:MULTISPECIES: hypothetical protein [unclassified Rhizobium]|uniref:DUF6894 family protein n=1 Tax=unclassified Rhizobium TaxID=2613769 RepID=UPI00070149D2|nr:MULTISPECIES: hypothetical protein [unclassified Rhizobium]KQV33161.1 hypothetical protein ASC86_18555 [Rhizobium sp. Root1212]KRD21621.1 hypothetical protein ASE37_19055 [Rhizobium sp. Root268]